MRGMQALSAGDPAEIGGYELRARLGQGGFGVVYLGLSPGGLAVAIKVLRPELLQVPGFLVRFRRELDAARMVSSVYTAPVLKAGLDENPPWVATACVAGPALDQVGPLPEPALWRLLAGLTEALEDIHAAGIIHRDLKPANVLLAAEGPKVIDFGISKALDFSTLTSIGSVLGTPAFMSPEQALARDADPASDIFSLGGVLAYAATGQAPFGGGPSVSVLYRVVHDSPALDGIPEALREVIGRCLAKDPAGRPSLAELSAIGRDGPRGHASAPRTAFWPPDVVRLIRDHQDRSDADAETPALSAAAPPLPTQTAVTAVPSQPRAALAAPQPAVPPQQQPAFAEARTEQAEAPDEAPLPDRNAREGGRTAAPPAQHREPGDADSERDVADELPAAPDPPALKTAEALLYLGVPVNVVVGAIYCIINFKPPGDAASLAAGILAAVGVPVLFLVGIGLWMLWFGNVWNKRGRNGVFSVVLFLLYVSYMGYLADGQTKLTFSDVLLLVPGSLALVIILLLFASSVNRVFRSRPAEQR